MKRFCLDSEKLKLLTFRRDEYKAAALAAKRAGDEATAKSHMKTAKVSSLIHYSYLLLCVCSCFDLLDYYKKVFHLILFFQQFDLVIGALQDGQPVDLSKMPPPPTTQSN